MLGLASVPLAPLLQECWVEGTAPPKPQAPSHSSPHSLISTRFRNDAVLGLASVPLAPLLQECWVDGTAPVYALASGVTLGEARVQVRCTT